MKGAEVQRRVRAARDSGEARGRRGYPEPVRAMVVAHARSLLQGGSSLAQAAADAGMALVTVRKWLAADDAATREDTPMRSTRRFRQLRVVESATPTLATSTIVVHGPGQLRIEGLTVEALAELLARLA